MLAMCSSFGNVRRVRSKPYIGKPPPLKFASRLVEATFIQFSEHFRITIANEIEPSRFDSDFWSGDAGRHHVARNRSLSLEAGT